MIQYKSLIQYTRTTNAVRFPQNVNQPFLLVYFSENSLLHTDYPKLKLRRQDVRHVVMPLTKIPVTRLNSDIRNFYKQYGLLPYSSNMNFPKDKNLLYDTTIYTNKVDELYNPRTYRQRAGFLIKNLLFKSFSSMPDYYKKILVYSIDLTAPANDFVNKKIFPILRDLKRGEIFFDDMLLVLVGENSARYRLLVKDREFNFTRVIQYIRKIKMIDTEEETDEEINTATNNIYAKVSKQVTEPTAVKAAISNYLKKNPKTAERIANDEYDTEKIERIAIASILYKTSGDLGRANSISNRVSSKSVSSAVTALSKQYQDELLKPIPSVNNSEYVLAQQSDIIKRVGGKTPEHIFEKRRIDFETNLRKDMTNAFKVLENRDISLKFSSISIKDKPTNTGELNKTDKATVAIKLKDKEGNIHDVNIDIPKINPDTGTFRVNGKQKCMINQIVLNPISFPKEYDSKFESSYSAFHITSKRTKKLKYLEVYIGSFKLPFLIMLSFSFGFKKSLDQYGIKYKIVDEKPKNTEYYTEVPSSYLVFENVDTDLKKEVVTSFLNTKVKSYDIEQEFLTKQYFNDLIIKMTGRVDSTYLITNNLENIVDPVVKQVLINKQLPYELSGIMQYMATKVVAGYVQERNDITHQRIRNSEVLVHLAQKELLKAYTEYRQQYLAGNKEAKLNVPQEKVVSEFTNLEIVQDMEYANPIEEMATITKVSPVGKTVGGIPDKMAIQLEARNVHRSYFGNIDPLDTSEGSNIGITQQLTVDAYITSARGLFGIKPLKNGENSGILSTSTSMIPFIENNEGARIIMASNQAKQMLPLKNPEPPITQSGYESLLTNVLSDKFIKRAPCNGKINKITLDYIDIICKDGKKQRVGITPEHLHSGSGKNTLSTFNVIVKEGELVKDKQVIAEGSCMSGGTISLGRNLAAGYMAYKGYNFEDGIAISERLVTEDKLTSLHGIEVEVSVDKRDRVRFITEIGKETEKGEPLFRKVPGDIDELLGYSEEDDEDVDTYDGQIIIKSPGGKVVDIEVFSNLEPDHFPILKEYIERTNKKHNMTPKEKYTTRGVGIKGIMIVFKIEQELKIGVGDKLCNRYGNKGIISIIEKEDMMPMTPWGERLDIVFSPLGVLGRMNMGQIYELYCGLISKEIAKRVLAAKSKAEIVKIFEQPIKALDNSKDKNFSTTFINNLKKLGNAEIKKMIDQIRSTGFVPIIVPPFQAPSYKHILSALKIMKLNTGYKLKLPEYNTWTHSPVPFGYLYISKLEHIGAEKVNARATGPMVSKTSQPTAGKRREGGQRVGEGDTWALASYNCTTIISEMFGPMSDDVVTKNEIVTEIIQTGDAEFRPVKASPTKDLLNAYFSAMMLGGG